MAKKDLVTGNWSINGTTLSLSRWESESCYLRIEILGKVGKASKRWRKSLLYGNKYFIDNFDKGTDKIIGRMTEKSYELTLSELTDFRSGKMRMNNKTGKFKLWNNDTKLVAKGKLKDPSLVDYCYLHPILYPPPKFPVPFDGQDDQQFEIPSEVI